MDIALLVPPTVLAVVVLIGVLGRLIEQSGDESGDPAPGTKP